MKLEKSATKVSLNMTVKQKIEDGFETLGHLLYQHHFKAMTGILLLTAVMASQLPNLTIDTSTESFLHEDDPTLLDYNDFRDQFGRDDMVVIAIKSPRIFTQEFLKNLKAFHDELKRDVPHVDDITSLINARNTRGEKDELIVEDLLEHWPQDEAAMQVFKKRVRNSPLYNNLLISEDGDFTAIIIKTESTSSSIDDLDDVLSGFDEAEAIDQFSPPAHGQYLTDEENSAVIHAVVEISERYRSADFPIYITGSPVITDILKTSMMKDMRKFMGLALVIIGSVLFILFRRLSGVFLPLFIVMLSVLSTLGLMAWVGVAFKLPTVILPSFLLAVGVGAVVHVLAIFYRHLHDHDDKEAAIAYALGHSGLAITMTSLTTACGLFSFASAEIAPVADLGQFAAAGALLALIYSIILLPAMLSVIPLHRKESGNEHYWHTVMDRFLYAISRFSGRKPWLIIGISSILMALSLASALRLEFSHNPLFWLPEESGIQQTTQLIDREMKGTVSLELIFDTGKENGLYSPQFLNKLDRVSQELADTRDGDLFVGKTFSLTDMLKEIHQALNENQPDYYVIPQNEQLIAQELLLFENSGSDDLEDLVDSQFSIVRLTSKMPWLDAVDYHQFVNELEPRLKQEFEGVAEITVTGIMPLLTRTIGAAMNSMAQSYMIAVFVITLMMVALIGNLRMGLISMIPNLAPIIFTLGVMSWLGMPLDMFTMLMGSIAIGLAVDDTIHFMHNFQRYFREGNDVQQAIEKTLNTAGRAMLVTSVVLSLGFFIFMFASMNNMYNFGLLTGIAVMTALLADFFLAPALVTVFFNRTVKAEQ